VCLLAVLALAAPQPVRAQASVSVETSPQLFSVLCALHAAGYESELSDSAIHPARAELRRHLLALDGPATVALREFYRQHATADPGVLMSRFVTLALVVGPPPKFEFELRREQLPPDVLAIEGFRDVLIKFHSEARIDDLWKQVSAYYDQESAKLRAPIGQMVLETASYLREVQRTSSNRTFIVYSEPLIGARTNLRSFGDRHVVIVEPGRDLPLDEIRHSFLHFLLDTLPRRYRVSIELKRPLHTYAGRAPRLPVDLRDDWGALFTECLVRAVEIRLRPEERRAALINEAERDGFVLVRVLDQALARFEQEEPAMSFYFPELVAGIDVAAETKRLETVQFASTSAPLAGESRISPEAELDRQLATGERLIARGQAEVAAATFERVLASHPEHPQALYGLAVASILTGQSERAKEIFRKLAQPPAASNTEGRVETPSRPVPPAIRAWSHIYLGRIYDVEDNRELALTEYRAALAVEGAPQEARSAAQRGISAGFKPARPGNDDSRKPPA